jgi:hypothetical protein
MIIDPEDFIRAGAGSAATRPLEGFDLPSAPKPMGRALTSAQAAALEAIKSYIQEYGIPPSIREVGQVLHLRSSSTIHGHFGALQRKGYISWRPGCSRSVRILIQEVE